MLVLMHHTTAIKSNLLHQLWTLMWAGEYPSLDDMLTYRAKKKKNKKAKLCCVVVGCQLSNGTNTTFVMTSSWHFSVFTCRSPAFASLILTYLLHSGCTYKRRMAKDEIIMQRQTWHRYESVTMRHTGQINRKMLSLLLSHSHVHVWNYFDHSVSVPFPPWKHHSCYFSGFHSTFSYIGLSCLAPSFLIWTYSITQGWKYSDWLLRFTLRTPTFAVQFW